MLMIAGVIAVIFAGSFMHGAAGFGFGILCMSLLPFFMSVKESTLIVLALALLLAVQVLGRLWRYMDWRANLLLLSSAVAARICSYYVLRYIDDADWGKMLLGAVLVLMAVYLLRNPDFSDRLIWFQSRTSAVIMGFLGGFIGGVFAVGGPFFVLYFMVRYPDKLRYNANLQVSFVVLNVFSLILHGVSGDLNAHFWFYLLIGTAAAVSGMTLGYRLFMKLRTDVLQRLLCWFVLLAGLNMLLMQAMF